jgi:hypothetical protein
MATPYASPTRRPPRKKPSRGVLVVNSQPVLSRYTINRYGQEGIRVSEKDSTTSSPVA